MSTIRTLHAYGCVLLYRPVAAHQHVCRYACPDAQYHVCMTICMHDSKTTGLSACMTGCLSEYMYCNRYAYRAGAPLYVSLVVGRSVYRPVCGHRWRAPYACMCVHMPVRICECARGCIPSSSSMHICNSVCLSKYGCMQTCMPSHMHCLQPAGPPVRIYELLRTCVCARARAQTRVRVSVGVWLVGACV